MNRLIKRALVGIVGGVAIVASAAAPTVAHADPKSTTVVNYDAADMSDYAGKWNNIYGLGEVAAGGTRSVSNGAFTVSAVPFKTAYDYSVYDHLKYIGVSSQTFAVPASGSLMFSVDIKADTPGTVDGRVIHGCYLTSGNFLNVSDPCEKPWSATALQGQQAGVVLNMINFATGQLFDWFVSGDSAFALIERLPSNVTGQGNVGLDKAYTQIIKEVKLNPGETHQVAIRYTRGSNGASVEYFLDQKKVAREDRIGIPLDQQHAPYTSIYPSLGPGELLVDSINDFVIGHGLFSLLDAFPFQHPDRPDLRVSIPASERIFGQGATGTFSHFTVTTETDGRNGPKPPQ